MMCETRKEIGGNCADEWRNGVQIHKYGPHLFHTNDEGVWQFLSRFTDWTPYEHRVVADTSLGRISIPYNQRTEQQIGKSLESREIRELIFRQYSEKQWGCVWESLPTSITSRVPLRREDADDRYFTDKYQGQPANGYANLFKEMLSGIEVEFTATNQAWRSLALAMDMVVYTGKLDEYFNHSLGRLPYRSLQFRHHWGVPLGHAQINQCNDSPITRQYAHHYFSNAKQGKFCMTEELPCAHTEHNEPFYPMPFGGGLTLSSAYKAKARKESKTMFLGRLATYTYMDMWMAVAQVRTKLATFTNI